MQKSYRSLATRFNLLAYVTASNISPNGMVHFGPVVMGSKAIISAMIPSMSSFCQNVMYLSNNFLLKSLAYANTVVAVPIAEVNQSGYSLAIFTTNCSGVKYRFNRKRSVAPVNLGFQILSTCIFVNVLTLEGSEAPLTSSLKVKTTIC